MTERKRKLGAIFLVLSMLLALPTGAFAWIDIDPGPEFGFGPPGGDTDPDDFPIVAAGNNEVRISGEGSPGDNWFSRLSLAVLLSEIVIYK